MTDQTKIELLPEEPGEITDAEIRALTEPRQNSPEPTEPPASSGECGECRGRVAAGASCAACGLSRANETKGTFIVLAELPYVPPRLDCCVDAAIEVRPDYEGHSPSSVLIFHEHSFDCPVWLHI